MSLLNTVLLSDYVPRSLMIHTPKKLWEAILSGLQAVNLLKKRFQHRCFSPVAASSLGEVFYKKPGPKSLIKLPRKHLQRPSPTTLLKIQQDSNAGDFLWNKKNDILRYTVSILKSSKALKYFHKFNSLPFNVVFFLNLD